MSLNTDFEGFFKTYFTVYHLKTSCLYSFMSLNTDFEVFQNLSYCLSSKNILCILVYEFEYRFRGFFKTHMIYTIIVYFCNRLL